jgi:ribose 5-phosphate isomerase B
MIRQLGAHDGKEIVFGFDRYLLAELDAYVDVLGRFGTVVQEVERDELHYLSSAQKVCERLRGHERAVGVLCCGTGMGMSIAANKFREVYAARCVSPDDARLARTINNANVLCIASISGLTLNTEIIEAFMRTPYEGRKLEELQFIAELEADAAANVPAGAAGPRFLRKTA